MVRCRWNALICLALCVGMCFFAGTSYASTIINLGLGSDTPPDIEFDGTTLKTSDDGDDTTDGDQNTGVDYQTFLEGLSDINTPIASFSLAGLTAAPTASVFQNVLVIQNFSGGTLSLYAPDDSLLLSASLNSSTLSGPLGSPATGALFTTSFADVTGGALAAELINDSLTFSMNMADISGGTGFELQPTTETRLAAFTADVSLKIDAEQIPEPTSALLLVAGSLAAAFGLSRRCR